MLFINETEKLTDFCESQKNNEFITVDTEFVREKTYYPKLCLIQVCGQNGEAAVIDPLAKELDLEPLINIMQNEKILKVFHSARQDIEIFYNIMGKVPSPIFDTQIAAMVCGYGETVSYEALVHSVKKVSIDKSSRFTNWQHRPLSEEQVQYALGDVTYLKDVYEHLNEELRKSSRTSWFTEELDILKNEEMYKQVPEEAWKRFKIRTDKSAVKAIIKDVAEWREREAQKQNVPRGYILKDEALVEIANRKIKTPEDLATVRGLNKGFMKSYRAKELIKIVKKAIQNSKEQTNIEKETDKRKGKGGSAYAGIAPCVELMRVLLKQVSCESGVACKLIASTEDIENLIVDETMPNRALTGWRREIFGEKALALKSGKIKLSIEDRQVTFSE
ncbi:MAG: ribonuclease D [Alphaproteobacteria bacterium]|nr:ribonuclease D [Alphaproteobacteria bacterium]MCL2504879.1 ribonuclease D [Alphaproteobacteria bacterium]